MDKEAKKMVLKKYVFIFFLLIVIAIAILLMIKYDVEGEKNMPFKLDKIIIKSTIDAQSRESENLWDLSLTQNNDIYIYIKRNEEKELEEKIKSIKIEQLSLENKKELGTVKVFLPTSNNIKTNFIKSTEDYIGKTIEYRASTTDNMEKQEICQNGGMLAIRVSNQEVGEYISNEGDELTYDGTLLGKAGISEENLKFKTKMDIIIETTDDEKYKGTITLDMPAQDFGEKGVVDREIIDFSDVVFKRCD